MKRHLFFIVLLSMGFSLPPQAQNLSELGNLDYQNLHNSDISDLWGYEDGNGNEYAIVGVNDTGVSIVDVTDPSNPNEIYYSEEQASTTWRDIVTHQDHAYIVNEGGGGLKIIDLSPLPGNTNLSETTYTAGGMFSTAHNLYIDQDSVAYIFGSDHGNGGAILLDLSSDPMNPSVLGSYDPRYVHDGVVRNDTLYACHIDDGEFAIVDVSTPSNPQVLGSHLTPKNFAHNAWISDDGDHLYTTDEKSDGYIGSFDVSDPSNIQELDRTQVTPGSGSIPHNTHFKNDYLITSYYRDGLVIHDVSRPGNMAQTGRFDTSPSMTGDGFNGAWGAYPWLPSGNILVSDIENGLFILAPDYKRGCYLEGTVSDQSNGAPIDQAKVTIRPDSTVAHSDITGAYANSTGAPGTYDVVFSEPTYYADTAFGVPMSRDSLTLRDMQLEPRPQYEILIELRKSSNGDPIEGAKVLLSRNGPDFTATSGPNGELVLSGVYEGTYDLHAGKWGFKPYCQDSLRVGSDDTLTVQLEAGYKDDFNIDLGWTEQSNSNTGHWERGEPNGTSYQGFPLNPDEDIDGDCGEQAYVTGNQGTGPTDDQVDTLMTILVSPKMDLSAYSNPYLNYQSWFVSGDQGSLGDDTMFVSMHGGGRHIELDTVTTSFPFDWSGEQVSLTPYAPFNDSMRVHFKAADPEGNTLTEAGVDRFHISDGPTSAQKEHRNENGAGLEVMPVPFDQSFRVRWEGVEKARLKLFDLQGKEMMSRTHDAPSAELDASDIPSGVYILLLQDIESGKIIERKRIIRE